MSVMEVCQPGQVAQLPDPGAYTARVLGVADYSARLLLPASPHVLVTSCPRCGLARDILYPIRWGVKLELGPLILNELLPDSGHFSFGINELQRGRSVCSEAS